MTRVGNTIPRFFALATLASMGGGRDPPFRHHPLSVLTRRPRLSEFSPVASPSPRGFFGLQTVKKRAGVEVVALDLAEFGAGVNAGEIQTVHIIRPLLWVCRELSVTGLILPA